MTPPSRSALLALTLAAALATLGPGLDDAAAGPGRAPGGSTASPFDRDAARLAGRGAEPTMKVRTTRGGSTVVRHVTLSWKGKVRQRRYSRSVGVPGIGQMTWTCRPDAVRISLRADDRDAETQMWMAKYEDKPYGRAVAVKTVRIYRYQHWYDDGRGGTGNPQHEGLNQRSGRNGVENFGKGYAHGVISQRGSRNVPVATEPLRPVTTFDVNWYWNGFDHPARFRSCKIDGVLRTELGTRLGVGWHGEEDAARGTVREAEVAGVGTAQLRCDPGRRDDATVTFVPTDPTARAFVETVAGEGRVEDHVETWSRTTDEESGRLGPLPLPGNGLVRLYVDAGGRRVPLIVSSYQKRNDPNPQLNTCEIAVARYPR